MNLKYNIKLIGIFCLLFQNIEAQDIEQVLKAKPVKVSGGLNVNSGLYFVEGVESRRDPYSWGLNANLNFNFFSVLNVPFSLVMNKGDTKLNRPQYSQFGFSPEYKGYKVHIGYRTMQLSQYSYSGLTFLGAGTEIKPKNLPFKFSGFYGRLTKAIPVNFAQGDITDEPIYERRACGSKISYSKNKHSLDLVLFKAWDDLNSIGIDIDSLSIIDSSGKTKSPKENFVIGFHSNNRLLNKLTLDLDYTLSFLSDDIRDNKKNLDNYRFINYTGKIFEPRNSTFVTDVFACSINYQGGSYSIGVSYKHIDPGYRSLGTTYSANDTEDWLLNLSKSLLHNKINLSGSIGKQRNNLDNSLETTNKRTIGSLNSTISITQELNVGLTYSNFSSNTQPVALIMQDSMKFIQTTKNKGVNINYNTGSENLKHSISTTLNVQDANTLNQTAQELVDNSTKVKTSNLSYSVNIMPISISINSALNHSVFTQDSIVNTSTGPTLGTSRGFFNKKVNTNLSFSFLSQNNNGQNSNATVINFNMGYRFLKKHNISFSNIFSIRNTDGEETGKIKEYRGSIRYSYSF